MQVSLNEIPIVEVLHFLGWRGSPIDAELLRQIRRIIDSALGTICPRIAIRRFVLEQDLSLRGTTFSPAGEDVKTMLSGCTEAVLLAATLGAESERFLLQIQARSSSDALLADAVLSAAIEAVCNEAENALRSQIEKRQQYLTDRFSPGYGDMPMAQSREICEVLSAGREIGLTVSSSGIMIPRKSVTAVMGISMSPVKRRASACESCSSAATCPLNRERK